MKVIVRPAAQEDFDQKILGFQSLSFAKPPAAQSPAGCL